MKVNDVHHQQRNNCRSFLISFSLFSVFTYITSYHFAILRYFYGIALRNIRFHGKYYIKIDVDKYYCLWWLPSCFRKKTETTHYIFKIGFKWSLCGLVYFSVNCQVTSSSSTCCFCFSFRGLYIYTNTVVHMYFSRRRCVICSLKERKLRSSTPWQRSHEQGWEKEGKKDGGEENNL